MECVICQKTRADLDVVREEFERYKLRAQSVLKNKTTKVFNLCVRETLVTCSSFLSKMLKKNVTRHTLDRVAS